MLAVQFDRFGDPDVLRLAARPDPHAGPGEVRIAVRAAGVNASDWKKRAGLMDPELPQTLGYEAAGVVDEVGAGVVGTTVGDEVFGFSPAGAAQAEIAVLADWEPVPPGLDLPSAAAIPASLETAARALDRLGVRSGVAAGTTLMVNGASGNVGAAAVQLAVARGVRVIGVAGPGSQQLVRALGAEPVIYGDGLAERVTAVAPTGVDVALDVAGNGVLPTLVALTGSPERVVTVADVAGAQRNGVHFSRGDDGRATYVLAEVGTMLATGAYRPPPVVTYPLTDVARAHHDGETGAVRGKIVLTVASPDPFDLARFAAAQEADGTFERALSELRAGRKTSHWMWFIFPQLAGLGSSATAVRYAIASLAEARAYLADPLLGRRLHIASMTLLDLPDVTSADEVLGGIDAMKLRSSMTLFAAAAPARGVFGDVLDRFFDGEPDPETLRLLSG